MSSDAEEEAKDDEKEVVKNVEDGSAVTITMVPRIRKRHAGNNKVQYIRNVVIILFLIAFLNLSILVSVYIHYMD